MPYKDKEYAKLKSRERSAKSYHNKKNDPDWYEKKLKRNAERADKVSNAERVKKRKKEHKKILIDHLGGKCVGCGTTHNLQFDHIDRKDKKFGIVDRLSCKLTDLIVEANKCQLLCKDCHKVKTTAMHDRESLLRGYVIKSITNTGNEITITYQIANETQ